jgi:hypothetical protein
MRDYADSHPQANYVYFEEMIDFQFFVEAAKKVLDINKETQM